MTLGDSTCGTRFENDLSNVNQKPNSFSILVTFSHFPAILFTNLYLNINLRKLAVFMKTFYLSFFLSNRMQITAYLDLDTRQWDVVSVIHNAFRKSAKLTTNQPKFVEFLQSQANVFFWKFWINSFIGFLSNAQVSRRRWKIISRDCENAETISRENIKTKDVKPIKKKNKGNIERNNAN